MNGKIVELTTDIVAAYVGKNSVSAGELPALIASVHTALTAADTGKVEVAAAALTPAVSIKKSITPDFLISLEDGRKFKSMKRYLAGKGMTPDDYRAKWGLPKNYPMVAPNYAAARSNMAKTMGLGRKAGEKAPSKRAAKK